MRPRATVTRVSADGYIEIDGRPALEFYERYLGTGEPAIATPIVPVGPRAMGTASTLRGSPAQSARISSTTGARASSASSVPGPNMSSACV